MWAVLLLLAGGCAGGPLDEAVDGALSALRRQAGESGQAVLAVADLAGDFTFRKLLRDWGSRLFCWGGTVGNVSALQRAGNVCVTEVEVSPTGKTYHLEVDFRFPFLEVYWRECRVVVRGLFQQSRPTSVRAREVVLRGRLAASGQDCALSLSDLWLAGVSRLDVHSAGAVAALRHRLLGLLLAHFRREVSPVLTKYLSGAIGRNLPRLCVPSGVRS